MSKYKLYMNWSDIVSIIISIVTLLWSIGVYLKHSMMLNKQQIKINELETKILEAELENSKKADIRVSVSKDAQNVKILTITNRGKAEARNVIVKGLDQERFCIVRSPKYFKVEVLKPQDSASFWFTINSGANHEKITTYWDDDYQQNSSFTTDVIIP